MICESYNSDNQKRCVHIPLVKTKMDVKFTSGTNPQTLGKVVKLSVTYFFICFLEIIMNPFSWNCLRM